MEKDIKLTIIVLCYNHEKYLEEAINSIKKQKCNFNYEIIIGDDASTDNSQEVIKKLTKNMKNVTLVLRNKNIGGTNNLYDLYMKSKGEYIIVLESDDFWLSENKLQTQIDFLEKNPEYIGVSNKIRGIDLNGRITKDYPLWIKKDTNCELNDFLNNKYFSLTATMYKNIFLDLKNDKKFKKLFLTDRIVGDIIICIYLLNLGKIKVLNLPLSAYRIRNDKKESNYNSIRSGIQKCKDHIKILNAIDEYYNNKINLKKIYNNWLSQGLYFSIRNKNIKEYKKLKKSIKNNKYIHYHNWNFWKIFLETLYNKIKR